MPKKARMEQWKKNVVKNIWNRRSTDTIFSAKESRRNHNILMDLSD